MDDLTLATIVAPLIWTCDVCHQPIADEDGWLTVDERAAWHLKEQWDRIDTLKAEHNGLIPFADMPAWPAHHTDWHAYHIDCDPDLADHWQYWFAIDRIRTIAHVLNWNAHLNAKPWMRYTNWNTMLCERISGIDPEW